MLYELELSEQCADQPDLVDEKVNETTGAVLNVNLANRRYSAFKILNHFIHNHFIKGV